MTSAPASATNGTLLYATSRRILLVEDEPRVRDDAVEFLRSAGFEVECAVDGNVALRSVAESDFALVLLDLTLVSPDGWTILRRLRKHHPDLPVLVASENPLESQAMLHGAAGLVRKPFEPGSLRAAIDSALAARVSA
jgi:DNA-binding response OmpR family regulator